MRNIIFMAIALMISTGYVTTGMALPVTESENATVVKKASLPKVKKVQSWVGEVISVDTAAKTFIAKNSNGEMMTFDVSDAKFKKKVNFATVKVGDQVATRFKTKDGSLMTTKLNKKVLATRGTLTVGADIISDISPDINPVVDSLTNSPSPDITNFDYSSAPNIASLSSNYPDMNISAYNAGLDFDTAARFVTDRAPTLAPESGTLLLFGIGVAGLMAFRSRRIMIK